MSFHKLKIGQRGSKQKSNNKHSSTQKQNDKLKERDILSLNLNDKLTTNTHGTTTTIDHKLQQVATNVNQHKLIMTRKPSNIMSISDNMALSDILKYQSNNSTVNNNKKGQTTNSNNSMGLAPKTDRVHKIEKIEFGSFISGNSSSRQEKKSPQLSSFELSKQQYQTASEVITFLNVGKKTLSSSTDDKASNNKRTQQLGGGENQILLSMKAKQLHKDKSEKDTSKKAVQALQSKQVQTSQPKAIQISQSKPIVMLGGSSNVKIKNKGDGQKQRQTVLGSGTGQYVKRKVSGAIGISSSASDNALTTSKNKSSSNESQNCITANNSILSYIGKKDNQTKNTNNQQSGKQEKKSVIDLQEEKPLSFDSVCRLINIQGKDGHEQKQISRTETEHNQQQKQSQQHNQRQWQQRQQQQRQQHQRQRQQQQTSQVQNSLTHQQQHGFKVQKQPNNQANIDQQKHKSKQTNIHQLQISTQQLIRGDQEQRIIKADQKQQKEYRQQQKQQAKYSKQQPQYQELREQKSSPNTKTTYPHSVQELPSQTNIKPYSNEINNPNNTDTDSPSRSKLSYKPINEIQLTILHQNKTLLQEVQKLRKERDQLQFMYKKQQIQLLQSNATEYYQKQHSRLKTQVQSLQSINQELKHQNFMLLNKNKQHESTSQVKLKETKKLLQQLQKTKIESTKEKFQLKDKASQLSMIVKQLQQRNRQLSQKFQLYYGKTQQLQSLNKKLNEEILSQLSTIKLLETKLSNEERNNKQKIKLLESQISHLIKEKQQQQTQYRESIRKYETEQENLKQSLKQLSLKKQSEALLISSRVKSLEKHNNNLAAEMQVVKLHEQVKDLENQMRKRSQLIKELNKKIDSMIGMEDYEQIRKQSQRINTQKVRQKLMYEKIIVEKDKEVHQLTKELTLTKDKMHQLQKMVENLKYASKDTSNKTNTNSGQYYRASEPIQSSTSPFQEQQTFKTLLAQQILQQDSLKQQLFSKEQSLHLIKQQLEDEKIKYEGLKNQHQILKKQFSSYENNTKIKKQIIEQQLGNQIESIKRKLNVTQKKLQSKIKQNQQKQLFIQQYIIGNNSKSADSQYLIKQIERIFLEKQRLQLQ